MQNGYLKKSLENLKTNWRYKKMITISKIDGEVWLKVYGKNRQLIYSGGNYRSISDAMVVADYWLN